MPRRTPSSSNLISLADEDAVRDAVWASILGLWKTVNTLTRLRPSRRKAYRVSIFGSARIRPRTKAYAETRRMAQTLAAMGCDIITGGGPGLMQAANEGAKAARRGRSYGILVDLPFEQQSNAFVTESFAHETFFTRLHQFVITSDAFVVTPGGIGTVLETMMIWQLLQVQSPEGHSAGAGGPHVAGPGRLGSHGHALDGPAARVQDRSGHSRLRRGRGCRRRRRACASPDMEGQQRSSPMKRKKYEAEMRRLQVQLAHLQRWVKEKGAADHHHLRGARRRGEGRDDPLAHRAREPSRLPRRRAAGPVRPREEPDVHAAVHAALPRRRRDRDLRPQLVQPRRRRARDGVLRPTISTSAS